MFIGNVDGKLTITYKFRKQNFKITKGNTVITPEWIDELYIDPEEYFSNAMNKALQNEQIQGMYHKAVQLYLDGKLTVSNFRDWVRDEYYGLKDGALQTYNAMTSAIEQGISAVVSLIKDYVNHISSIKANKSETAFEFPVKSLFYTKAWDWGIVIGAVGKVFELVGAFVATIGHPIIGAITTIVGFIGDGIGKWITNSYTKEVTFSLSNLESSTGFVNPLIQIRYDMKDTAISSHPLADEIMPALKTNGAYIIHLPGIECIAFATFDDAQSEMPVINTVNIELRLSCDFMINQDYYLNEVLTPSGGYDLYNWPDYETLITHGSSGHSITLDSATDADMAAMIANAYICYAIILHGPFQSLGLGLPSDVTPAWIKGAIECSQYLTEYYRGNGDKTFGSFMSTFTTIMGKICSLETPPTDSDMTAIPDDLPVSEARYLYPLSYMETLLECDSYDKGGRLYFNRNFATSRPESFNLNVIRDFPAPAVYPPKYTRGAKIFGYAISIAIVAAVTFATVYATFKIKKYTNRIAASNASAVEARWSDLSKSPTKENYAAYYAAVKRNNRWAKFGVGNKISAANYWSAPSSANLDANQLNEQLNQAVDKISTTSTDESGNPITYTIEDIYKLVCGTPLSAGETKL